MILAHKRHRNSLRHMKMLRVERKQWKLFHNVGFNFQ